MGGGATAAGGKDAGGERPPCHKAHWKAGHKQECARFQAEAKAAEEAAEAAEAAAEAEVGTAGGGGEGKKKRKGKKGKQKRG